jgi:hypothetical protein
MWHKTKNPTKLIAGLSNYNLFTLIYINSK